MSLSKIVISGKVVKAPEKRFTPTTNIAVTEFIIAVESLARNEGPIEVSNVKIVTWRDLAERCATEIHKGDLVCVDGRLQVNNMQSSEGRGRKEIEIDAIFVENLTKKFGSANASDEPDEYISEDRLAGAAVRSPAPAPSNKPKDVDAIFGGDDEIPF